MPEAVPAVENGAVVGPGPAAAAVTDVANHQIEQTITSTDGQQDNGHYSDPASYASTGPITNEGTPQPNDVNPTAANAYKGPAHSKRKKATRACSHCQKAHLTCDDSRPCLRCVKRGLGATCQDGVRKKAKYLHDADLSSPNTKSPSPTETGQQGFTTDGLDLTGFDAGGFSIPPFDLSTYDFGSKTANLEYSILSNMLGSNGLTPGVESNDPLPFQRFPSPGPYGQTQQQQQVHSANPTFPDISMMDPSWGTRNANGYQGATSNTPGGSFTSPSPPAPSPQQIADQQAQAAQQQQQQQQQLAPPQSTAPLSSSDYRRRLRQDPESVYASVTKPFSYTPGYHALHAYLRSRFPQPLLIRIARAITHYRPSFIALTKTLTEQDLIFMEKCFQRTLLEYEKFISYSGTPTVVWRRTGEVAGVGKEFCLLTGWGREQLLGKRTFIVELMDDSSVVEYFERFSTHAFGDTSNVMTTCVLMTPQRRPVPCTFCFTIKRDVFDIPMMIIGNVSGVDVWVRMYNVC
ncbi:Transcriptional regulator of nonfermentable carbon utilization [Saitoella coloradoensis]